jgi:Lon protease-like protein
MAHINLFPLHTVLFPGMPLSLRIFEERYILMINRCLDQNEPFGVVAIRQGMEANGPLPQPQQIGCRANIIHVERLEHGRFNIIAIGDERFAIQEIDTANPYLAAEVENLPMILTPTMNIERGVMALRPWINAYLDLVSTLHPENAQPELLLSPSDFPEDPLALIYMAAAILQIPLEEKQKLLEEEMGNQLLFHVSRLYRREMAILRQLGRISAINTPQTAALN